MIICQVISKGKPFGMWPSTTIEKNTLIYRGILGAMGVIIFITLSKAIDISVQIVMMALSMPITVCLTSLYGKPQLLITYIFSIVEIGGVFLVVFPDANFGLGFWECKFFLFLLSNFQALKNSNIFSFVYLLLVSHLQYGSCSLSEVSKSTPPPNFSYDQR